jgi:preprotein translocase subunit SecA
VVQAAVKAWGQRGLLELEAEERLAIACEKSPTQDSVIAQLRKAFNVSLLNWPLFVDVCSMQIIT